jgi:hypothetical protein
MTPTDELKDVTILNIREYPILKEEILSIYDLAISEIEEGGSPYNEVELAIRDITEIVANYLSIIKDTQNEQSI